MPYGAMNRWTYEESVVAFNLYCKIPFNQCSARHPLIQRVAGAMGRSAAALNMKIGNFGRFDPELRKRGIVGLRHGAVLEQQVWDDFSSDWDGMTYQSEQWLQAYLLRDNKGPIYRPGAQPDWEPMGYDLPRLQKQRVNQDFFRAVVLANYNNCCCVTGLGVPELLVASHIVPWSVDQKQRTNPANGLCLNALHDAAFDRGLITFDDSMRLVVSRALEDSCALGEAKAFLLAYKGQRVAKAERFRPQVEFLAYHRTHIFRG